MNARPRVFVSSVIEGFGAYRQAAARAIEAACGEPVLVNEQLGVVEEFEHARSRKPALAPS